jgi:hypothetical protein
MDINDDGECDIENYYDRVNQRINNIINNISIAIYLLFLTPPNFCSIYLSISPKNSAGTDPTEETERLVRQFGGEVVPDLEGLYGSSDDVDVNDDEEDRFLFDGSSASTSTSTSTVALNNHIGRFLVARKRDLRKNSREVAVLALRHELHRTEIEAAQLVAQHIAENPPDALMAVITPKDMGGFRDRRRGPDEDGGGAPCPSEFLLHRAKRTTTAKATDETKTTTDENSSSKTSSNTNDSEKEGDERKEITSHQQQQPSRHHPNQQR